MVWLELSALSLGMALTGGFVGFREGSSAVEIWGKRLFYSFIAAAASFFLLGLILEIL